MLFPERAVLPPLFLALGRREVAVWLQENCKRIPAHLMSKPPIVVQNKKPGCCWAVTQAANRGGSRTPKQWLPIAQPPEAQAQKSPYNRLQSTGKWQQRPQGRWLLCTEDKKRTEPAAGAARQQHHITPASPENRSGQHRERTARPQS